MKTLCLFTMVFLVGQGAAFADQVKYACRSLDGVAQVWVQYDLSSKSGKFKVTGKVDDKEYTFEYDIDKYSHQAEEKIEYDLFFYTIAATGEKSVLSVESKNTAKATIEFDSGGWWDLTCQPLL